MRYRHTKGDCYTLCELLETLTENKRAVCEFAQDYNYEPDYVFDLIKRLHKDVDSIIAKEQSHRDDTDEMAIIMKLPT